MKLLTGPILLIVLLPLVAAAQDSDYSKGHGYFYAALPGPNQLGHFGGGAEALFSKYGGIGVDAGYMVMQYDDGLDKVTVSLNIVGRSHPKTSENKVEPFVSGGYTHFFPSGGETKPGFNFGGGVNWWFRDQVGLRFEVRDSVEWDVPYRKHHVGFRIALTFG